MLRESGYIEVRTSARVGVRRSQGATAPSFMMENPEMPRKKSTPVSPAATPASTSWRGDYSLEQREAMIREAAYFHAIKRGNTPGHELDDWLAAEAELEREASPAATAADAPIQQSGVLGASKDDQIKQTVKRTPRRSIPQIEGVEPELAPFKE